MAYSRAPVTINLTDTIEEMRAEVNALTAKLNELFDGSNNFVTGASGTPAIITTPTLSGAVIGTYTLAGTPTLTNPTINAATITGTIASTASITGTLNIAGAVLAGASPLIFEASTDNAYELTLAVADVTADRTITLPDATGTVSLVGATETLTNKTISVAPTISVANGGTIGSASDADSITIATGGAVTFSQRSVHTLGITVANGTEIGSAGDPNAITIATAGAVTFSQRDVHTLGITIANGTEIGSAGDPNAITISSGGVVAITATTANTSASDGALTIAGGLGVALDATIGDDLRLISDDAILSFGANSDVAFTHVHNDGLILKNTGANTTVLTIQSSDTDVADGNILGEIDFQAPSEGAGSDAILVSASIAARSEGDFSTTNNATELVFKTGASEDASTGAADGDMILSSGGNLTVSGTITGTGGIDFSGTANAAGMSSELFDDYEEGVYTATITCGSGTITLTSSINSFAYTKIGRLVTLTGRINVSSISSPSGTANFNLPFTNTSNLDDQSEFALLNLFSARADVGTGYITLGAEIPGAGSTTALIIYSRDADSWTGLDASDIAADAYFYLNGSYITD